MYQFKGTIEVYNDTDIADDSGHLASCDNAEIAITIAAALNDEAARQRLQAELDRTLPGRGDG